MQKIIAGILAFSLFFAISFGMLFLMLKLWVAGQLKMGNGNFWLVKLVQEHPWRIMATVGSVWIVGLLIALPFMIRDGFFNQ